MTFRDTGFFLNTTIPTAGRNVGTYALPQKATLKSAGWVIVSSGDGLALYSAVGDVLVATGVGAGGMSNPRAWYIARRPDGGAFFCWQFIANAATQPTARVKYSLDGFTTGAPSSTVVPGPTTAGDEAVIIGGGTDAVPTGQIMYGDVTVGDNPRRFFGGADSAAPYGFWFCLIAQVANNGSDHGWLYDPMQPWVERAAGNDPYIHYIHIGTGQTAYENGAWNSYVTAQSGPFCWLNKSLAAGATTGFVRMRVDSAGWGGLAANIEFNNRRDLEPIFYVREPAQPAPRGLKGVSSLCTLWMFLETVPSIVADVNADANVVPLAVMRLGRTGGFGGIGVPWDGTLPSGYTQGTANLHQAVDMEINPDSTCPDVEEGCCGMVPTKVIIS